MAGDNDVIGTSSAEELLDRATRFVSLVQRPDAAASRPGDRPPEDRRDARPQPDAPPGGGPEDFDAEGGDYKAFDWAGNQAQPTLLIILKDGAELGFNYADLATAYPGGSMFLRAAPGSRGNVIRLLFHGDDGLFVVVLEGIRLRQVWGLLMRHQTPWIQELPEGAESARGEPVIRSVAFQRIERGRPSAASGRGAGGWPT